MYDTFAVSLCPVILARLNTLRQVVNHWDTFERHLTAPLRPVLPPRDGMPTQRGYQLVGHAARRCEPPSRSLPFSLSPHWTSLEVEASSATQRIGNHDSVDAGRPRSQVLHLGAPATERLAMCEDPHAGSLAHVDSHLSHCTHLFNACASIQSALQMAFELCVDLILNIFRISLCIGCRAL